MKDALIDEKKLTVFDIQRFSVNDGSGVRTLIFFKGCPLRCRWCHNPESLCRERELMYFAARCTGCRACEKVCPNEVHSFKGGIHRVDHSKCRKCGSCLSVCCYNALSVIGREYTIKELLEKVQVDRPYFGTTGGVTLSGGEPMYQGENVILLAEAFYHAGINVCMETCGFAKTELYEKIAPYIDCFLYDYKATPGNEYKRLTGVDSNLIIENLSRLDELGKKIILRCPMIPGYNDTKIHLEMIAKLSWKYLRIEYVEILPYHSIGEAKREQLGKERNMSGLLGASAEQKEKWISDLKAYGCNVRFA